MSEKKAKKAGLGRTSPLADVNWEKVYALRPGKTWPEIATSLGVALSTLNKHRWKYDRKMKAEQKAKQEEFLNQGADEASVTETTTAEPAQAREPDPVNDIAVEVGISPEEPAEDRPIQQREATKPWNAEDNPWSLDLLRLQNYRPGFRCRFTTAEKLETKLMQGWTVADKRHYGGLFKTNIPGESGEMDTRVRRRELILIETPDEMAKARRKFFEHKTDSRSKSAMELLAGKNAALKAQGIDPQLEVKITNR